MAHTPRVANRKKLDNFQMRNEKTRLSFAEMQSISNQRYNESQIREKDRQLKRAQNTIDQLLEHNHNERAKKEPEIIYVKKKKDIIIKITDIMVAIICLMFIYLLLMIMSLFFRYLGSLPF